MSAAVKPGSIVEWDRQQWFIIEVVGEKAVARNLGADQQREIPVAEASNVLAPIGSDARELLEVPSEKWDEASRRYRAVAPLVFLHGRTAADFSRVAIDLQVSRATVYRLVKLLEKTPQVTALVRQRRSDRAEMRLDPAVASHLKKVVDAHYLTSQQKKISRVHRELVRICRRENLQPPHVSTMRRYIAALPQHKVLERRRGGLAALGRRLAKGSLPDQEGPYGMLQIDHTKVDIELVDSHRRLPVGRPWITIAIDVKTRMVAAWCISFDPPGALSTGICITNAVLPKHSLLAHYGVDYEWPCSGFPGIIHADNAKEFRGRMLQQACREYGFDLLYRKLKKPNYGAHIERLQGTLLSEIHDLPGTTFSNPAEKGTYRSAEQAVYTIEEFEQLFAHLVLGLYHNRRHSALGVSPLACYKSMRATELVDGLPIGSLDMPSDVQRFRLDFLPPISRTIQPYGISVDGIAYQNGALARWVGAKDPRNAKLARRFLVRRDPRNIGQIYFFDPSLERYYAIPYRDPSRRAISLWELRAADRYLEEQGAHSHNEDAVFRALDQMEQITRSAGTETRKARRDAERQKQRSKALSSASPNEADRPALAEPDGQRNESGSTDGAIEAYEEIEYPK